MDVSVSGISFSFQPSELYEQTSALQYVNSQLVAHGFARSPGLSLDGLPVEDGERVLKCLMGMLSQRIEDVKRTEELGSKLRTLSYENDRLQSMHRTAVETGANAEREMNLHKCKLVAVQKQHTSEVTAHKQTSSELQKTRTALQYLRSTTQNELKRKDKEVERVLERWNKVADSQIQLSGINSGLYCANYAAATEDLIRGKGIMEEALEQAEEARSELVRENEGFRSVILSTTHVLQDITYDVKSQGADKHLEEPPHLSPTAIFAPPTSSLSHPDNAHIKLRELFSTLRDAVSTLSTQEDLRTSSKPQASDEDVTKLKEVITSLRTELDQIRQSSATASTEVQKVFDRYTKDASERLRATQHTITDLSMELIGQTEQDEIRSALESRTKELEAERARFTEATIKLGKEKSALEEERMKLVEEKRRWAVEQMLADLPPTPGPDPDILPTSVSPKKSTKVKPSSSRRTSGSLRSPKKSGVLLKSPSRKGPGRRVTFVMEGAHDGLEEDVVPYASKRVKMRRESKLFEAVDVLYDPEDRPGGESSGRSGQDGYTTIKARKEEKELHRSTTPDDPPPDMPEDFAPRSRALTLPAQRKSSSIAPVPAPVSKPRTSHPLILPTMFTLPPPSPASSLSFQPLPIVSSSVALSPPQATVQSGARSTPAPAPAPQAQPQPAPQPPSAPAELTTTIIASSSSSATSTATPSPPPTSAFDKIPLASLAPRRLFPSPRTPRALSALLSAHPHAKKHAYSPARPSPLSRILMIAESPASPGVGTILEEEEGEFGFGFGGSDRDGDGDGELVGVEPLGRILKRGLGLAPIDEPSPLRERTGGEVNEGGGAGGSVKEGGQKASIAAVGEKEKEKEKRFTAKEKGKGKAVTEKEKENIGAHVPARKPMLKMVAPGRSRPATAAPVDGPAAASRGVSAVSKKPVPSLAGLKVVKGSVGTSGVSGVKPGGARRVPVGSSGRMI